MSLPGPLPERLAAVLGEITDPVLREWVETRIAARNAYGYVHSAEWVAFSLRQAGHSIGESTIKKYRRLVLNRQEV